MTCYIIILILLIYIIYLNYYINKIKINSKKDELTQLYNRKYMNSININEYYIIIADIDKFKNINDLYGHNIGDKVLVTFSKYLKIYFKQFEYKRKIKIIRWGGEEFLILFPRVDLNNNGIKTEKVINIIEKLRQEINNINILTSRSEVISITSSFGINFKLCNNINIGIELADNELYKAKNSGRNKICYIK